MITDRFGRIWTLKGDSYICDGFSIGANAKDPLATMNAMAPQGWQADQAKPDEMEQLKARIAALEAKQG